MLEKDIESIVENYYFFTVKSGLNNKSMFNGYFKLFEEDHSLNQNKLEANCYQLSMQFDTIAFNWFWKYFSKLFSLR